MTSTPVADGAAIVGLHPFRDGYTFWVIGPAPGSPRYVTVLEAIAGAKQQGFATVLVDSAVFDAGPDGKVRE